MLNWSKNPISVNAWIGKPSYGKMHIPSCDFSSMISPGQFEEFVLPVIQNEVKRMTHNIFHLDGKGVAEHLDYLLAIPEINAFQWVQGAGETYPIMQWLPLIKKNQAAGKSVMVILQANEHDGFIKAMDPQGLLLYIIAEPEIQTDIIKRVGKW